MRRFVRPFMIPALLLLALRASGNWYEDLAPSDTDEEDRVLREISNRTETGPDKTENPFAGRDNRSGLSWPDGALKDVAYYLRQHKFNEYDRRYYARPDQASRNYFAAFPRPPLRSLHWEVHKFCEPSFSSCVEYLIRRIKKTGLRRADDTTIVIHEQQWNKGQHSKQISAVEEECRKTSKSDDVIADPFEGPIERFQWRSTASYYMCWYTMNEVADLKDLKDETCDNFANCLDPRFGVHNRDPRANDTASPFSCALYSFCPDPCCPREHANTTEECWNSSDNPCFKENPPGHRRCTVNRSQNSDFRDIILNRWNVTCECARGGYEWDSKYGMCVDVDECLKESPRPHCDPERESCVNLPGTFRCGCRWGFVWSAPHNQCRPSPALDIVKSHNAKAVTVKPEKKAASLVKRVYQKVRGLAKGECGANGPGKIRSLLFAFLFRCL